MNDGARRTPAIDPGTVPWRQTNATTAASPAPRRELGDSGTPVDVGEPVPPAPARQPAPAIWWVLAGVLLATAIALLVDTKLGIGVLAATCLAAGIARLAIPGHGPEGITIRTRTVDVMFFFGAAAVLVVLVLIAPAA